MNEQEKQSELRYFEKILEEIRLQLAADKDRWQNSRGEFQDILANFWENRAANFWDQAQHAETIDRQRSLVASSWQRQARFLKMIDAPYFGRIDFCEEQPRRGAAAEPVYLGIAALTDSQSGVYLIYDWRSPVAGMFYDFEPGAAWYDCPAGRIRGTITLKRQYQITNSHIKSMFDTDLKIDDEILQEVLSNHTDTRMRTIVNSIQREQNQAIRDEAHRLLFVQGPAGSGKTSIALHRAAYLLYRERDRITARNILILSPNRIFSDYISGVLPALGEENVIQTTFGEYVNFQMSLPARIESREAQLEQIFTGALDSEDDRRTGLRNAAIRFKSSPEYTKILQNYRVLLDQKIIRDAQDVLFRDRLILSRNEWICLYQENLAYLPPRERLAQIRQRVQVKLRPIVKELRLEKEMAIAASGEEVNEKTIKAMARISARRELDALEAELEKRTTLNPFALYRQLFTDSSLRESPGVKGLLPDDWGEMASDTLEMFDHDLIPYEDLFPFLYFQGLINGFAAKNEIRHLIVDEAQDYTSLQFAILRELFPKSSWTVLGDPDQAVHPFLHTADFAELARLWGTAASMPIRLQKSYRSTREIQTFCQALLQRTSPVEIINRSGTLPQLCGASSRNAALSFLEQTVTRFQTEGYHSIAIICKTAQEAASLYEAIAKPERYILITQEAEEFQHGLTIIPVYLAKGLEFDAVIVPDAGSRFYGQPADGKLLYIACTRALHQLALFYEGECSPFVAAIDPKLYRGLPTPRVSHSEHETFG